MTLITIARALKTTPQKLEKESVKAYLEKKLNLVSEEIFSLQKEYQVKTAKEFEKKVKSGEIHEFSGKKDNQESFFKLQSLEEEKTTLARLLKQISANDK